MYRLSPDHFIDTKLYYPRHFSATQCTFANCLASHLVVLEPALPATVTQDNLAVLYPAFRAAVRVFQVVGTGDGHNITVAEFASQEEGTGLLGHL